MNNQNTKQSHQQLLAGLIRDLELVELPFYQRNSRRNWLFWHVASCVALLATVASTVVASFMTKEIFAESGKAWLIILPAAGTLASGLLHLYRPREKEVLREEGRIEMQDIILDARSLFASASSEEEYKLAYHKVRVRAKTLETHQHRRDAALRSDEVQKPKKRSQLDPNHI